METNTVRRKLWRDPLLWFATSLTIFGIAPFLQPGYHWGANDARHHVYFLFEYNRLVEDGIWWPRWSPDFTFGYGYPFFNIYGPLSHFLAELLIHFFNFSYTGAIEAIFCFSIVGSAITMYGFVQSWLGRKPALISALVYVYAPYHLLNLYVRANLAESMAFVWLPLVFWVLRSSIVKPSVWAALGLAASMACLLMTSQLVTILSMPLLVLYGLMLLYLHTLPDGSANLLLPAWVRLGQWIRSLVAPVVGAVGAMGLSAIFWLPMVAERQYVRADQWFDGRYNFEGHFVYLFQFFSPLWGFGVSELGADDRFPFQIGVVPLLFAFFGVLLIWQKLDKRRWEIIIFAAVGIGAAFFATQLAAPLWKLPILGQILGVAQFPWRWLNVTTFCVSILAGLIIHPLIEQRDASDPNTESASDQSRHIDLPLFILVAVVLLGSFPLLRVQIAPPAEGPIGLPSLMRFQHTADEMTGSTKWVKEIPIWSPMADEYLRREREAPSEPVEPLTSKVDYTQLEYSETGFVVDSLEHNTVMEKVWYFSGKPNARIVYNHFYYPGWNAYLWDNDNNRPIEKLDLAIDENDPLGRMAFPVPQGEGYVMLRFEDTPPRILGRQISQLSIIFFTIIGLIAFGMRYRRRISA